jgi:HD-GYP domain-containing protein (c-di-GMP phosphodiesterase class II)
MGDGAAEIRAARQRRGGGLGGRERLVEPISATLMVLVAAGFAMASPSTWPDTDPVVAGGLIVMLAVLTNVELEIGAGAAVPTQLAFIPLLFLIPPGAVPAAVVCGYVAGALVARGPRRGRRVLLAASSCWFCVLPALVLLVWGPPVGADALARLCVVALAAQIAGDLCNWRLHGLVMGDPYGPALMTAVWLYAIDIALTPVGLLVVLATPAARLAFLLPVAVVALLELYRRERAGRLDSLADLSRAYRGTALLLGEMIEGDDAYTGAHSAGVVDLARRLAADLAYGGADGLRDAEFAALLHDIGKTKIPKQILHKPGPLDDQEWSVMRLHPVIGADMLTSAGGVLAGIADAVRHHHERWDGGGYPDGLQGEQIPLLSRILAVCDTYNAITTERPYRQARDAAAAVAELRAGAGTQFDPRVVAAFLRLVEGDQAMAPAA